MAQKVSPPFRNSRRRIFWTFVLLFLLVVINFWIFIDRQTAQEFWASINLLLVSINACTVLRQQRAQLLAERFSLSPAYYVPAPYEEGPQGRYMPTLSQPMLLSTPGLRTEVLLVSVTDLETRTILAVFPPAVKTVIQNRTYYDLGIIGTTRTCLVQATGMGPAMVRSCIEDSIRAHRPMAVVLVGIAFGLQDGHQRLGDVLVSRQVQDYDPQRWGTGPEQQLVIHNRGNRVAATEWLLDRFSAGKHDWDNSTNIHTGLILSGSLLIDHWIVREHLLQLAPEALGGEMEGAAFCDVAHRHHVSWIVVKAIADWADGKKQQHDKDQQHAAENAARFVLHVIQHPDFIQQGRRV